MVMSETLPLANVKSKFSEMVDRVEHTHDRIIVTRNGRPAAVLISPESRQAYADGDYITGEELRSRYLTK
jgi:antitoxin YefM